MPPISDITFRDAIHKRRVEQVRSLLAEGADITTVDDKGMTPLTLAASVGSPEIVRLLLDVGADVTPRDKLGYTARDLAYWPGEYRMGAYTLESLKIVEMLKTDSHDAA